MSLDTAPQQRRHQISQETRLDQPKISLQLLTPPANSYLCRPSLGTDERIVKLGVTARLFPVNGEAKLTTLAFRLM